MSRRWRCDGACDSKHRAHGLTRPADGTNGCGSGCRDIRHYTQSPGKQSPDCLLFPAQTRRIRFSLRKRPFSRRSQHPAQAPWLPPNPLAQRPKPDPKIRRNLTPCQATGERDAHRIPLEVAARVWLAYPVFVMATIALKRPEQNRGRPRLIPGCALPAPGNSWCGPPMASCAPDMTRTRHAPLAAIWCSQDAWTSCPACIVAGSLAFSRASRGDGVAPNSALAVLYAGTFRGPHRTPVMRSEHADRTSAAIPFPSG